MTTMQLGDVTAVLAKTWATVDDIVKVLDKADYWSRDFKNKALERSKKVEVRRLMRANRGEDGLPVFPSVTELDAEGKLVRRYKQIALFNLDDFKKVIHYHLEQSDHHKDIAKVYANRCEKQLNYQLDLFDADLKHKPVKGKGSRPR